MGPKQVSLLLADVRGITRLHGAQVEAFVTDPVGQLAKALSAYNCLVKNTWCDAWRPRHGYMA